MDSDRRRILVVVVVLGAALAAVLALLQFRSERAPRLVDVRVVTQARGETVATDRLHPVPPGTDVTAAAVVGYTRGNGGPVHWICALPDVEVDGHRLDVEPPSSWPSSGGTLKGLWYKVEPRQLGATGVTAAGAADRLNYKDFLAMEMGRRITATVSLESHNDDFLSKPAAGNTLPGGVFRIKVRVGAYKQPSDLVSSMALSSPGAADVFDGKVAGVIIGVPFPAGIDPAIADVLRLGCFTFAPGVWPGGGPGWPLALSPEKLVAEGFIATPRAVAAVAAAGQALGDPWEAPVTVISDGTAWRQGSGRAPLRWGRDVHAGDALRAEGRYLVLLKDDGDGVLSLGDEVLFAWGEPAQEAPLGLAFPSDVQRADLLRVRRAS